MKVNSKIKPNLDDDQFNFLKDLSMMAKERDLLEPGERKKLFEAGRFKEWFPSRVDTNLKLLEKVEIEFNDTDITKKISSILEILKDIDVEEKELEYLVENKTITDQQLFRQAEIFYEKKEYKRAYEIFKSLLDQNKYSSDDLEWYSQKSQSLQ